VKQECQLLKGEVRSYCDLLVHSAVGSGSTAKHFGKTKKIECYGSIWF
jgi:hypothetical protein